MRHLHDDFTGSLLWLAAACLSLLLLLCSCSGRGQPEQETQVKVRGQWDVSIRTAR